jgi:hypothetical protein
MGIDIMEKTHYGVELRLTIREISMIAEALAKSKEVLSVAKGSDWDNLSNDFQTMSNLTQIESLRKFGTFDTSRLNFK